MRRVCQGSASFVVVVCIVVRFVFMSCSVMVSGFVLMFFNVSSVVEYRLFLETGSEFV